MSVRSTPPSNSPELDEAALRKVEAELEQILASSAFRNARRSQELLRYLVTHKLAGETNFLKERAIGSAVFQRAPDYDTGDDSIVRVKASELRKRLAQYYVEAGPEHDVQIEVLPGSYSPEFRFRDLPVVRHAGKPKAWIYGAIALGVVACFFVWRYVAHKSAFERFWAPVFESRQPVLLCLANPAVFMLQGQTRETFQNEQPELVPSADITMDASNYAGVADAIALAQLSGFFNRMGYDVQIRTGNDTSFADLRSSPAILIGAFTNPWTMQMTQDLRFVFDREQGAGVIRDQMTPGRNWRRNPAHPGVDYCLLSRIFDSRSGRIVITAAGLAQVGTQLAGEFLTNPAYLEQAIRNAPADWTRRNIQLVIEGEIIGRTPGPPKVVESWYW